MTRQLRTPQDIIGARLVSPERLSELEQVASRYAVAITPAMADLIDPADPADPVGRQFLPSAAELDRHPEELVDPIGDDAHSPVEGIVHRYPDRVLLKPVGICAVYCRYCFRRESVGPGKAEPLSAAAMSAALAYIRDRPEIWEVILTGGDPLVMSPRRIRSLMSELAAIDHVKVVRVHTRVPAADPGRVTTDLVNALRCAGKATWIVLHANHARELTPAARAACAMLVDAGLPMLSQSVLLRGVNDDEVSLEALLRALVEARIKPYYLHHADLAPGTAQFRTSIGAGQALLRGLRGRVSGLCQPSYVLDLPGGHGKSPVGPCYLRESDGELFVEDWQGGEHGYGDGPA